MDNPFQESGGATVKHPCARDEALIEAQPEITLEATSGDSSTDTNDTHHRAVGSLSMPVDLQRSPLNGVWATLPREH